MSGTGLSVSDVVNVSVLLSPVAAATRNFGIPLVIGPSAVLASTENFRIYTSLTGVGDDFPAGSEELGHATAFFSQAPQPAVLYIGALRTGETLVAAVTRLAAVSNAWYCLLSSPISDATIPGALAAASYIEGLSPSRIAMFSSGQASIVNPTEMSDPAGAMMLASLTRTAVQYSTTDPFAASSLFGRIATVNFAGVGTTITLKFQQEPGVTPETLTETVAQTLLAKRCNFFVNYQNGTAIVEEGTMAFAYYIDERVGVDWLQNALQVAGFNALYGAGTKIPQTDAGMNILATAYEGICTQAVTNGLFAPGVWTGPTIPGVVQNGQALTKGYEVYMPPISTQSVADRAARKAVVAQIVGKLAGAVHSSNVVVSVVR